MWHYRTTKRCTSIPQTSGGKDKEECDDSDVGLKSDFNHPTKSSSHKHRPNTNLFKWTVWHLQKRRYHFSRHTKPHPGHFFTMIMWHATAPMPTNHVSSHHQIVASNGQLDRLIPPSLPACVEGGRRFYLGRYTILQNRIDLGYPSIKYEIYSCDIGRHGRVCPAAV